MVSAGMEGDEQYPHWRQVRNYVCALAAVAVVLQLRVSISAVCGTRVMLNLFSLAVLVSAYLGGAGPGLLSTGLVTLCVIFLLSSVFNF